MKQQLSIYAIMLILDSVWLKTMTPIIYRDTITLVQKQKLKVRLYSAVIVYLLLGFGIHYFVLNNPEDTINSIAMKGAIFGFLSYGIFNGTNHAIFNNWDIRTSIIDTLWGTLLCCVTSILVFYLNNY